MGQEKYEKTYEETYKETYEETGQETCQETCHERITEPPLTTAWAVSTKALQPYVLPACNKNRRKSSLQMPPGSIILSS